MNLIHRAINKLRKVIYERIYKPRESAKYRARLKNKNFSIICNNYFGGMLYHDLGLKFLSPTVNLYFDMGDYIEFLENLGFYLNCELTNAGSKEEIIGLLNNKIKLHGVHYSSFDELKQKWEERRHRVNYDNLYIIGAYRDGCTDDLVKRFCNLPYKNKIFLSHKYVECENNDCIVIMKNYKRYNEFPGADKMASCKQRLYDETFDFVNWLNA